MIDWAYVLLNIAVPGLLGICVGLLLFRLTTNSAEERGRRVASMVMWDEFNTQSQVVHSPSSRILCELIQDRLGGQTPDSKAAWERFKRERAE